MGQPTAELSLFRYANINIADGINFRKLPMIFSNQTGYLFQSQWLTWYTRNTTNLRMKGTFYQQLPMILLDNECDHSILTSLADAVMRASTADISYKKWHVPIA